MDTGSRHGVALTQDINVNRTKRQWELCQANKIGVFFCKPPPKAKAWSYWEIVQLVVRRWAELKQLAVETKRPFGFVVEMHKVKLARL